MTRSILLLTATLLSTGISSAAEAPETSVTAQLGALVPAHHNLQSLAGSPTWYEYQQPPEFRYEQPDFDSWAAKLDEVAVDPTADRFVAIWRDGGGAIRYVLAKGNHTRLFSIDGDAIEFEDPGFQTQVGVARWGWFYDGGLLRTHRNWRFAFGPRDENGVPTGPPTPSALFSVISYEYGRGKLTPSNSRTYWSEEDRQAGRWGQKTTYDANGRHKKTKHNPERPYPY